MKNNSFYEIRADPIHHRLEFRFSGYWSSQVADEMNQEAAAAMLLMQKTGRPWVALVDVSHFPPQAPQTQEARLEMIQKAALAGMKKMAYYVGDAPLTKQQLSRMSRRLIVKSRFFATRGEADSWLLDVDSP